MKNIILTKNKIALVSDEDFERISEHKWFYNDQGYACRDTTQKPRKRIYLHREIMNFPIGQDVDHINGDILDNRRENLRICSRKENSRNSKKKNNTNKFKGIYLHKPSNKYCANIKVNKKTIYLGLFYTAEEAARAYDKAATLYFKEFARTNY